MRCKKCKQGKVNFSSKIYVKFAGGGEAYPCKNCGCLHNRHDGMPIYDVKNGEGAFIKESDGMVDVVGLNERDYLLMIDCN